MFGLDGYSTAYGLALIATVLLSAAFGKCARRKGALLLVAAWFGSLSIYAWSPQNLWPLYFTLLDFAMVMAFGAIWLLFNRRWGLTVASIHVGMIATHWGYVLGGEPGGLGQFVYLSILAVLGYAAMAIVALPPVIRKLAGGGENGVDYRAFLRGRRLPASAFEPGKEPQD